MPSRRPVARTLPRLSTEYEYEIRDEGRVVATGRLVLPTAPSVDDYLRFGDRVLVVVEAVVTRGGTRLVLQYA